MERQKETDMERQWQTAETDRDGQRPSVYLPVAVFVRPSIYLAISASACWPASLPVCLSVLSVTVRMLGCLFLSVCLCLCLYLCLCLCLCLCLSFCLSVFLSVCPVCPSCLSVCLSVCSSNVLPAYLPGCLLVCLLGCFLNYLVSSHWVLSTDTQTAETTEPQAVAW